jgi:hypothetical protein
VQRTVTRPCLILELLSFVHFFILLCVQNLLGEHHPVQPALVNYCNSYFNDISKWGGRYTAVVNFTLIRTAAVIIMIFRTAVVILTTLCKLLLFLNMLSYYILLRILLMCLTGYKTDGQLICVTDSTYRDVCIISLLIYNFSVQNTEK